MRRREWINGQYDTENGLMGNTTASYYPLIHFRRGIAHQSIFGVVLPINPFSCRIAHQSIFGVVLPINPFSASYCPFIHFPGNTTAKMD
jgi:hypothetical protein